MNNAVEPAGNTRAAQWRAFIIGVCLFVVWLAGLVALVVTASNPVTINVVQLSQADCIVVATISNPDVGEFTLQDTILGSEPPDTFRVLQFGSIIAPDGDSWLMALRQEPAGNFSVVPVPYRNRQLLLVYPGDEAVVEQARELVQDLIAAEEGD
jgi:hypothetical protein